MSTDETTFQVCDYAPRTVRSRPWVFTPSGIALISAIAIVDVIAFIAANTTPTACTTLNSARAAISPNGPVVSGLELFKYNTGRYPSQLRDLFAPPPYLSPQSTWRGPYLINSDSIKDPWGQEFRYIRIQKLSPTGPHEEFKLWSVGPDGLGQTPDDIHVP